MIIYYKLFHPYVMEHEFMEVSIVLLSKLEACVCSWKAFIKSQKKFSFWFIEIFFKNCICS